MSYSSYHIISSIGNTPLVQLQKIVPDGSANVFVKLEYFNPTGSYKDRMAYAMIDEAEKRGELKPGMTVVEYTGGSTGTSLAWVCSMKGYKFIAVSSNAFAKEKLQAIKLFGGQLELIHSPTGEITPDLIPRAMARAQEICQQPGTFATRQFENADAVTGYSAIGKEILQQLPQPIAAFCGAAGTAGMISGVSRALKAADANTKIVVLEPAASPVISQGVKGNHKVEGIGSGFVPPLLKLKTTQYDEVRAIDEQEARAMARLLATKEGIFAGTSSGLNVVAALQLAKELGPGHNVVTVACDSGMKYLAGDLYQ
ncbi:PLP-dependent cysteine synthase family protein [Mucilaginibacter boryungensis]|uniref:Cysteine synthase family protein n=1 Tax=Mucilaginibacter boryungensis TaxID=768480 RepID=A0ABR9XCU9_9SPHI|nr:cysteine synthase family protein [Mucilaginibacter boryungensis]MBE9665010.1 cysteine synthase family protein [Mucilaginibacter boryungensis]